MKISTISHRNRRSRRRGAAIIYVALGLIAFVGAASLSVDMGNLYSRRASAQLAADAAALAGAYEMANFRDSNANNAAIAMARRNGYDNTVTGVIVTVTNPVPGEPNRVMVRTSRVEPLFFARIFGFVTRPVSATATAEYSTEAPLSINGGGQYGSPDGPTTLSMFGPDALRSYGDYRSVRQLTNGANNPDYYNPDDTDPVRAGKAGYDFIINVPTNMNNVLLEIFDPDCYNAGGDPNALQGVRVDELRRSRAAGGGNGTIADATTTRYTLYWDPSGRGDFSQYRQVGQYTVGADSATDMKWHPTFNFNRSLYTEPTGRFILKAVTTGGSSENGFTLRAGPPRSAGQNFDPNNGTSIFAEGNVPINFNGNGQTTLELGTVPSQAAGKQLTIRKFDTDIQSQQVIYTCDTLPGRQFTGILAGNDQFTTDTLQLPTDYQGGKWYATYSAGSQDTSVWEMSYSAVGLGRPGPIRLVR
jgi:Flp pilus assembly protein TadG